MKIINPELEKIAVKPEQYPSNNLPEIALAGRSNVGKSSLINSLVNRKNLARTSSKPGKTRTVNFYNIDGKFRLVDLPGYGYAAVSKSEKDKWAETIETYLSVRENLREVILLVDIRHEPTENDVMMYNWIIEMGFSGYVIATKLDKIGKSRLQQHIKTVATKLGIDDRKKIIYYSSETKENRDYIYKFIEEII
ncbi:ribosome biogenesis GTP-binding protein YihA/YsxC [Helcococcus ovis]|uniref:Probable GTP-binding protein EngB n=4 Tax=Helcococcus ovis TaxID=72026 RepID=A0A4R9C2U8_9FIRM|nr:ribosome biogenesis GTP-binding protein YihA/YsxC [Helcococcus ovis]TFF66013.1 YihA family ribosome biogenesis GTP-binding protein [Helcococcus ovis]TFF66995.1 YihA family ribosome biogenesis GTP-binding protein [Helcococcus ovis]TFF68601.1 YihA family ribosome biogenesis GTP-binding protein [Helcococcus ovis]WNZ01328.1 ribosome biogenesis GTP-binding protein YihA/YsxC [Helcococcus ovis]